MKQNNKNKRWKMEEVVGAYTQQRSRKSMKNKRQIDKSTDGRTNGIELKLQNYKKS